MPVNIQCRTRFGMSQNLRYHQHRDAIIQHQRSSRMTQIVETIFLAWRLRIFFEILENRSSFQGGANLG